MRPFRQLCENPAKSLRLQARDIKRQSLAARGRE